MGYPGKRKWIARPAASSTVGYGLALVSVAAALGRAHTFLYFHLPHPFTAFALSAIAITLWYGGTKPGILAAVLSLLVCSHFLEPDINTVSRVLYDLVFLILALLMTGVAQARNELEVRVAERTEELIRPHASEDLKLEIVERKRAEAEPRQSQAYLAEGQRLSHTGNWAWTPATGEIRYWSEECHRLLGFDLHGGQPQFETSFQRIHPDDHLRVRKTAETAGREEAKFELDYRIVHPGSEIRDIHVVGHPVFRPSGDLVEFACEPIICSLQAEDGQFMFSVSDTGVGFPPQQADQIFNAFFTTKPQGTGVGFRISRSIVESHGGRLWSVDNPPRGASFHLTLPTKVEVHE